MGAFSRPLKPSGWQATATNDGQAPSDGGDSPTSDLGDVVADVGSRVQGILDTAARVAAEISAEAEASAANRLEESRREADGVVEETVREITSRTETLGVHVEAVQREAVALIEALDHARNRLIALTDTDQPAVAPPAARPASTPPSPTISEMAAAARPSPSPPAAAPQMPEQAVLRATQMAVAGAERRQIEDVLRNEFAIDDPVGVVDKILRTERV